MHHPSPLKGKPGGAQRAYRKEKQRLKQPSARVTQPLENSSCLQTHSVTAALLLQPQDITSKKPAELMYNSFLGGEISMTA